MNPSSPTELPTGSADRPQEYVADTSFDDLALSPELRRAIAERGYVSPTPVQARAFRPALEGKDLVVRSKTGTGKTAAFGMPIIERIPMGTREVKALVLCPTRELALQVAEELTLLAKYRNIGVTAIYGGASMKQQEDALRAGSAIIVGTPGRVYDHIRRGNLKLDSCGHVVLDEADEMLNQGFYEEVTRILDCLPKNRQVLLFSATVPEDIQRLIARYTTNAETLLLSGDVYTVEHIKHIRYDVSDAYPKPRNLLYVIEMHDPDNAIIFCNTRDDTELVTAVLNRNGLDAEMLNGDLPQKERERVMGRVKRGELAFMVATDLAARGIDISDLGYVINYSLPEDPAVYLHRVGRTGRIGKSGIALNLVSGRELSTLSALEKKYGVKFEHRPMPTPEEAATLWTERHVRQLKEAAQGSIYEGFLGLAQSLKARPDADELIAFMLRYFFTHRRMERARPHGEAPQPPAHVGRRSEEGGRRERDRESRRGRSGRGEGRDRAERTRERGAMATIPAGAPAVTAPGGARSAADRERFEEHDASQAVTAPWGRPRTEAPPERKPQAPKANQGARRLSDRELFELMQAGTPLPAIDDPADAAGPSEPHAGAEPRRERRERRPRREDAPVEVAPGNVRMWVNLGRADHLDEAGISSVLESLGAPVGKVAKTELRNTFAYVHVAEADVPAFEALTGKPHGEKPLKIERARR
jgi:ATP-dependent RNA helicase DeaD